VDDVRLVAMIYIQKERGLNYIFICCLIVFLLCWIHHRLIDCWVLCLQSVMYSIWFQNSVVQTHKWDMQHGAWRAVINGIVPSDQVT
jgi:hypothetical protein